MTRALPIRPLTAEAFAPFGQVISTENAAHYPINAGMTERFHDLAAIELAGDNPRPLISIFRGQPYALPLPLTLVERHPLGSQAFMPLADADWLVIVAPDESGAPGPPHPIPPPPRPGGNKAPHRWPRGHTPPTRPADFLVIDRGGDGVNLEEYTYSEPWMIG